MKIPVEKAGIILDKQKHADATGQEEFSDLEQMSHFELQELVRGLRVECRKLEQQCEALTRPEKMYRQMVEYTNSVMLRWKPDGTITFVNQYELDYFGFTPDELLGENIMILVPNRESTGRDLTTLAHDIAEHPEKYSNFVNENVKKNGERVYIAWTNRPIFDTQGNLVEIISIGNDITAIHKKEQLLQKSEERLSAFFGLSPARMTILDDNLRFVRLNETSQVLFGKKQEEIVGKSFLDIVPDFAQKIEADARQVLETGETLINREVSGVFPGNLEMEVTWITSYFPLPLPNGKRGVGIIAMDITDRKLKDAELSRYRNHLEELVKERTKDMETFDYSVSHNLRAPLRSLDGFSLILLEDYAGKLGSEGEDYLHRIRASAQFMGELIEDLLALSRITRVDIHRADVNLSVLVNSVMENLRRENPGREVETIIQGGVVVDGDFHLLRSAMEHLLENAWKFTSRTSDARIEFGSQQEDGRTIYFVRDNGVGFDMQYAGNLFIPFRRLHTEQEFPGTGIGLSLVKRIIERHGGKVWAEGEPGKGATFYFTLRD